jgi:hypothetical protein
MGLDLETIGLGVNPNDGAGDKPRVAGGKINRNFGKIRDDLERRLPTIGTIAALRAFSGFAVVLAVGITGYHAASDGAGFRVYVFSPASDAVDDGGSVIKPNDVPAGAPGRWHLDHGGTVNVRWFGAKGDGIADDTPACQAASRSGARKVIVPAGDYLVKNWTLDQPLELRGMPDSTLRPLDTTDNSASNTALILENDDITVSGLTFIAPVSTTLGTIPGCNAFIAHRSEDADQSWDRLRIERCRFVGGRNAIKLNSVADSWIQWNIFESQYEYSLVGPSRYQRVYVTHNVASNTGTHSIRLGSSTTTSACRDTVVSDNIITNCGLLNPAAMQEGLDLFTNFASRVVCARNIISGCAGGIECKTIDTVAGDADVYADFLVTENVIDVATGVDPGIMLYYTGAAALSPSKIKRLSISRNKIHFSTTPSSSGYGIIVQAMDDANVQGNEITNAWYGIYLYAYGSSDKTMRRPVVIDNILRGCVAGIVFGGDPSSVIDGPVIARNVIDFLEHGIRYAANVSILQLLIEGNTIKQSVTTGAAKYGIFLAGLTNGIVRDNAIQCASHGVYFYVSSGAANVGIQKVHRNHIVSGLRPVRADGTVTVEVLDNVIISGGTFEGIQITGGAVVTAANNSRGIRSNSPQSIMAGSLGDVFHSSAPTAGATRWYCTLAGTPGSAVWLAQ